MKLSDLPPALQAQADAKLKAQREAEYPAFLEAARVLCDAADAPRLEKELLKNCCNELCRRGIPYLHLSPKAREKAGWPDLTFPLNSKFVAAELKTAKGIVKENQKSTLAEMARNGAVCAVIRTFPDFVNLLNGCNQ